MEQFHPRLDEDVIYYAAGNLFPFDHKERHYYSFVHDKICI